MVEMTFSMDMNVDYSPDRQYRNIMLRALASGDKKEDRTGVGTLALWGEMAKFDLSLNKFPIITTKRVFWKTAIKEMLFFLSGSNSLQDLLKENVKIWTDWPLAKYRKLSQSDITQEEFENRILNDDKFAAEWGNLGDIYGASWRRWEGADGQIYDQIADVVDVLKNNPNSRRILFHAWNVPKISGMALPPCHMVYQYQVTSSGRLNSIMYQRSCDINLGLPFNWVGQAALQMMLAKVCNLELGDMVWMGSDVHLYSNHIEQAALQLNRDFREQPTMFLIGDQSSIDDFTIDDFRLDGYDPHPAIAAPVAV